jgi:hypothetical protein
LVFVASGVCLFAAGCASPYYTDRGAALGGVGGAGVGALIGSASGHPGAGALIGAATGALGGAAVGAGLDGIEARNRAQIAAQMGQQLPPGGVNVPDVVAMSRSGVNEELIVNHIRANGMAHPVQAGELIQLQQEGVSPRVIATMQATPPQVAAVPGPAPIPAPVPYYYPPPPPPYWGYYYPRAPWGVTFR